MRIIGRRIMEMLREEYPDAEPDQSFAEIGMDSLDYIEFVGRIEQEFGVTIEAKTILDSPRMAETVVNDLCA